MDMVEGQEKKTRATPISVLCADNLMGRYWRNKLLIKSFADKTNCGYRRVGIKYIQGLAIASHGSVILPIR